MTSIRARSRGLATQSGFTLIEVLSASLLIGILMAISFPAIRGYWHRQSLAGAVDVFISEARSLQARVTSESHPLVYGVRFSTSGNAAGTWGLVQYDPTGAGTTPSCVEYQTGTFDSGVFNALVQIESPSFAASTEQTFCRTVIGGTEATPSSDVYLFFYARGTATEGSLVLHQPNLGDAKDITLEVAGFTGRISRS